MRPEQLQPCAHQTLSYTSSPYIAHTSYAQPTQQERLAGTKPKPSSKSPIPPTRSDIENFPAPLVLPNDDLSLEPDPPQDFQVFQRVRNAVTSRRRTIYVVPPPLSDGKVDAHSWTMPLTQSGLPPISSPKTEDLIDYLAAFYDGLPVQRLEFPNWGLFPWTNAKTASRKGQFIGLSTPKQRVRIRARPSPDKMYPYQLNLTDLLDAAVSILPSDAYALCLLVDHDLFEDEDDIFVCGRAFGGKRVAVVSTARYNPALDDEQSVEQLHVWPASHCKSFIESTCNAHVSVSKRQKTTKTAPPGHKPKPQAPLEAALTAFTNTPDIGKSPAMLSMLWLVRMARTISHELSHCFGIGHCAYYACIMQGSASISEDMRQPPYLCPVDLAKLLWSTGGTPEPRYRALLRFCERPGIRDLPHFAAYAAWLRVSLELDVYI